MKLHSLGHVTPRSNLIGCRKAKEDQEIKTAAENPTGAKAANHEKGMENALNFVAPLINNYFD